MQPPNKALQPTARPLRGLPRLSFIVRTGVLPVEPR